MTTRTAARCSAVVATVLQWPARAHVGSPDVFLEAHAGPYRLFVTVRPPHAIPGVADVDVLTTGDDVRDVHIVPLPLTGDGAKFAPVPDRAVRSDDDPKLFTGHLWLMGAGAWQVRITVNGDRGEGTMSVPVPTLPQSTLAMSPGLRGDPLRVHAAARRRNGRHRVGDGQGGEARRGRRRSIRARSGAAASPGRSQRSSSSASPISAACGGALKRPRTIATSTSR